MKTALTIAGSDSSGGAGIQADIKTMTANGVYAMSAITALTAQNTTGVTGIFEATPEFLAQEIDAIFTDIYPDAVKIGMVSSAELIGVIAEKLHTYGAKHIVVDPVMVATSGSKLLRDDAVQALTETTVPCCARAATRSTMPTTFCGGTAAANGSAASALQTPIPTAPAVPCPAPLRPIWQRAMIWMHLWSAQRPTFPAVFLPCWIWATAPARWTICLH